MMIFLVHLRQEVFGYCSISRMREQLFLMVGFRHGKILGMRQRQELILLFILISAAYLIQRSLPTSIWLALLLRRRLGPQSNLSMRAHNLNTKDLLSEHLELDTSPRL